ncbi:MAG: bacterial transcriptional activator domain-containing protein [Clostridia bacterium]|nr:bacterial transcriptional activator domain-containing protein [Clostridia bacterium]
MGVYYVWRRVTNSSTRFFQCYLEEYPEWEEVGWQMAWKIKQTIPSPVRYHAQNMVQPDDFPFTGSTAFLVSGKVVEVFKRLGVSGIDYYDAEVVRPNGEIVKGYALLNVLTTVPCMDREKSVFTVRDWGTHQTCDVERLSVDASRVPPDTLVFRLLEDVTMVVVHDSVKRALEDAGVTGIRFVPTLNPEPDSASDGVGDSSPASVALPERASRREAAKRPLDQMMESVRIMFAATEEGHEFFEAVINGRFFEAARIADTMTEEDLWGYLMKVCMHGPDLRVYSFWVARLLAEEKAAYHFWAAVQFVQLLPDFEGGFYLSIFHLRRAMELEPDRFSSMRLAFRLYGTVNEGAYPRSEALRLGREVMQLDPDDDEVVERMRSLENPQPNQRSDEDKDSLRSLVDRITGLIAAQSYSSDQRRFLNALLSIEPAEAAKLGDAIGGEGVRNALALFASVQCDVLAYGYWVSRLLRRENAQDHYEAARQLSANTWAMTGAHTVSLFHARRALELDPENDEYRQLALSLSDKAPEGIFLGRTTGQ